MSFYEGNEKKIIERLLAAHDPTKAIIRNRVFQAEYEFFREHIQNQKVLVCGSGLGHDSFELAKHNQEVIGVELLDSLVAYAYAEKVRLGLKNVHLFSDNLTNPKWMNGMYIYQYFDSAVMNMGTIGNFTKDEQAAIIFNVGKLAKVFYFDFYPPTEQALQTRKQMYLEEYWGEIRIEGTTLVSEEGLYSQSYDQQYFEDLATQIRNDGRGAEVKFHQLTDFAIMAEIKSWCVL